MPTVPEIEFVTGQNAMTLTGEEHEFTTAELELSTFTYRRIQARSGYGSTLVDTFKAKDMGDGSYLFYSRNPVGNHSNYALSTTDTNFEHLWSTWRGQRWIEVANVDEGFYTFQDVIEFHKDEVFSEVSTGGASGYEWVDENTLYLSSHKSLRLKMASGWTAHFTHTNDDSTSEMNALSGGDAVQWSSGEVHLDWLQHTEDGEVTIYEEGAEEKDADTRVYDDTFERVVGQVVDSQEITLTYTEAEHGAETVHANYPEGEYTVNLIYTADNIETDDVNETIYTVRTVWPDGTDVPDGGSANNQTDAEVLFLERLTQIGQSELDVRNRQAEANEQALAVETQKEEREAERDIPLHTWDWYLDPDNLTNEENPFREIVVVGPHLTDKFGEGGKILQLTDIDYVPLIRSAGFKCIIDANYQVKIRMAAENWHYFVKNIKNVDTLTLGYDPIYEQEEIEQVDRLVTVESGRTGLTAGVGPLDIIVVTLTGGDSGLQIDIDDRYDDIATFAVIIDGEQVSVENPQQMNNEVYLVVDEVTRLSTADVDTSATPILTDAEQCASDGGTWNYTTAQCEMPETPSPWELDNDTVIGLLIGAGLIVGIFILIRYTGGGE